MELDPRVAILTGLGLSLLALCSALSRRWHKPEPNLQQWANRLIEHVDSAFIVDAYRHFAFLVENGLEPEHAFEIVIHS